MLSRADNEYLCRVGPHTPMGNVFRRYWLPIATLEQLPTADCDPLRVRVLGEDFVAFRNSQGRVGLLDERCIHRRASLALGRVHDGGIRCLYHGWKFGCDGELQDVPNYRNPQFKQRMRANAYPVREGGGLIWAYIGPAEKEPPFPHYAFFDLPPENRVAMRINVNHNYLQNIEGALDSSHTSTLHADYVRPEWFKGEIETAMDDTAPELEVEDTDFGYHYAALRSVTKDNVRIDNIRIVPFVMPSVRIVPGRFGISIGGTPDSYTDGFNIEVPMDDEHTSTFQVFFGPKPVDREGAFKRLGIDDPKFWSNADSNYKGSADNQFGQDRSTMDRNWAGLKGGLLLEDMAVIGSMGSITDRSLEHLVPADRAIVHVRRFLKDMAQRVERGEDPVGLRTDYSRLQGYDGPPPKEGHWRQCVPGHVTLTLSPIKAAE